MQSRAVSWRDGRRSSISSPQLSIKWRRRNKKLKLLRSSRASYKTESKGQAIAETPAAGGAGVSVVACFPSHGRMTAFPNKHPRPGCSVQGNALIEWIPGESSPIRKLAGLTGVTSVYAVTRPKRTLLASSGHHLEFNSVRWPQEGQYAYVSFSTSSHASLHVEH